MLASPFPALCNPFANEIQKHTEQWVWHYQLIPEIKLFEKFCYGRIGELTAWNHPTADPERLKILSDWCAWLFIFDDICDTTELGRNQEQLYQFHQRMLDILRGATVNAQEPSILHALADLYQRARPLAQPQQWERFLHHIELCFEGCRWESQNRINNTQPDIFTYIKKRPFIGGLYAYIELMCMVSNIYVSYTMHERDPFWNMARLANRTVCWANDLQSFVKEQEQGDLHNLVLIVHQSHLVSLERAIEYTNKLYHGDIKDFKTLQANTNANPIEQQYIELLQSLMVGYIEWSHRSARYQIARHNTA